MDYTKIIIEYPNGKKVALKTDCNPDIDILTSIIGSNTWKYADSLHEILLETYPLTYVQTVEEICDEYDKLYEISVEKIIISKLIWSDYDELKKKEIVIDMNLIEWLKSLLSSEILENTFINIK